MGSWLSSEEPPQPSRANTSYHQPSPVRSTSAYNSSQVTTNRTRDYYYTSSQVAANPTRDYYNNSQLAANRARDWENNVTSWQTTDDSFYQQARQLQRHLQSLRLSAPPPERSVRKPRLFNIAIPLYDEIYTLTPLSEYDPEYSLIVRKITNRRNFKVDSIEKIENPYLERAFQLKKVQKEAQFPDLEELLLFHGTKTFFADNICKFNFNWRLCQTHKYGRGVSFSPNSTYASVYSDKNVRNKVMFVAKVLVGRSCVGNQFMDIPPEGFDTSHKVGDKGVDRIVVVKYEDNDFCPVYKINYHVMDENVGRGKKHRGRGGQVRNNVSLDHWTLDFDYD